ncbi:hypothetical protein [Flavobacterium pectinovorum]|uniref:Uncharacterized protein n=1 Tax=Flavobacterium pectinovorum TaxID=29533 RepID=A0AB36P3L1_9FLAO|nr:hypothetical protein [Flavobacterium pectinovorum]OXB06261.1 hypothetical protein B0A72_09760 [Flavobacterium pectinovorum]SHM99614.1 hypothetical protein SAMN05444387_3730 [Flavobacterium pectinovorum]
MNELNWEILITPLLSFIGVIIGAFLAFFSSSFLKKKETRLKISEKILDKKLEAHENVLQLAKYLRSTISENKFTVEFEPITFPIILANRENYLDWKKDLFIKANNNSHWLSNDVLKEIYFIQDYFANLDQTLDNVPDENIQSIGIILKNDFINLSNNLEKSILKYFENGWKDLKTISKNDNYKLSKKVSIERLNNYNHNKRYLEISKYFYQKKLNLPKTDLKPVTLLYEIAPNGMKVDMLKIIEIPNRDNSGVEYELFFQENEYNNRFEKFGYCELIMGNIRFDKANDYSKYVGISNDAMNLLAKWINENKE